MPEEFEAVPLSKNATISTYVNSQVNGKAAQARELKRQAKIRELKLNGMIRPATLLNFNPLPISNPDGRIRVTVPACNDIHVAEGMRLSMKFNDKTYFASYVTVREPIVYPIIRDVKPDDEELVGQYDFGVCKPIEIIHSLHAMATVGRGDSSQMYGVLMFEGDKHVLKSSKGKKGEDESIIIRVPTFENLPDHTREFYTVDKSFEEELKLTLDAQKVYCEAQLQRAQSYYDDPDMRKNITSVHRTWHQFALDMGWKEKAADWMVSINDPTETCKGCGAAKARTDAFFCHKCNRPYDAYAAYMAGEDVPVSHLSVYEGKQLEDIKKEMKRRKDKFADLQ